MARKTNLHKIEIRQREGSMGAMAGANTEVLIDGKPLKGATKVEFSVEAGGLAKLKLELLAIAEIKADAVNMKTRRLRSLHSVGELAPVLIVKEGETQRES